MDMHDTPDALVYGRIENPEAVLAGTLCLMSAFLNGGGCGHLAQKVIHNLSALSTRAEFSGEFRRVCLNLRAHWCQEYSKAPAAGEAKPGGSAVRNDLH